MFRWNSIPPVDIYLNAFNLAAEYYITQTQNKKISFLVSNLLTILLFEENYNTYRHKLATIIKFTKKYFYMLNAKYHFIIYTD